MTAAAGTEQDGGREIGTEEIKAREMRLLTVLRDWCAAKGLAMFLCGGTLLGAIRHKGFIPWDDDIDVFLPRPDYERLREIFPREGLPGGIALQDWRREDEDFSFIVQPFLRLADMHTVLHRRGYRLPDRVFIDIFPIDGMPDGEAAARRLFARVRPQRYVISQVHTTIGHQRNPLLAAVKLLARPLVTAGGLRRACARMERTAMRYGWEESRDVGGVLWGYGPQERLSKADLEPMEVEFEGGAFPGFRGYDRYLSALYGDYMTLPPESERQPHHEMVKCLVYGGQESNASADGTEQ